MDLKLQSQISRKVRREFGVKKRKIVSRRKANYTNKMTFEVPVICHVMSVCYDGSTS